jgi:hypothetical protein
MKVYKLYTIENDGIDTRQNDFTFDNPPAPPVKRESYVK